MASDDPPAPSGPYVVTWLNEYKQTQWLALDAAGLTAFSEWHTEFHVTTSEMMTVDELARRIGLK